MRENWVPEFFLFISSFPIACAYWKAHFQDDMKRNRKHKQLEEIKARGDRNIKS